VFLQERDQVDAFERKFANIDGQYYFTLGDLDWMLPISEQDYVNAVESFVIRYRLATVVGWLVSFAIIGFIFYKIGHDQFDGQMLAAFVAVFAVNGFAALWAQTSPAKRFWLQLRALNKLDDDEKAKLLRRA
jgi:hypothetical protein